MTKTGLIRFLVALTVLSGIIWFAFDVPELEPVIIILIGIVGLLEATELTSVDKKLAVLIGAIGMVFFFFGLARASDRLFGEGVAPSLSPTPSRDVTTPTSPSLSPPTLTSTLTSVYTPVPNVELRGPFPVSRVSVTSNGEQANSGAVSSFRSVSADGRYVVFVSNATNLVDAESTGSRDVFVHDRIAGKTTRISVAPDGTPGNGASTSGPK